MRAGLIRLISVRMRPALMEELCGGFMKINQKQIRRGRPRKNQEAHGTFLQQPSVPFG